MPLEASKANPSEAVRCTFFRASESGVREFLGAFGWFGLVSIGGVWLCRTGCREVGFWCGGAFCTVEFHLSLRGFGWFGLVSRWCLVVSHGLPRGRFLVWRCVLHGRVSSFFRPSESDVREFFGAAGLAGWA